TELQGIIQPCPAAAGGWESREGRPLVVDFYVPWCKPCLAMTPLLEEVAEEYAGRVDFYQVDIDKERRTAVRFRVRNVPAMAFISAEEASRLEVGSKTKAALREAVERILRLGRSER
ncbi:MAG: thioredoxin family protein, partial [Rikenella sp.]|nr:thioredoxin family protein [Rikenella sp.]